MMNNRIIEAVGKVSGSVSAKVADWRLVETRISRQEHYFVRSRRELARSVRERTYALTLYVDSEAEGKKFRGDATVNIQPSYTDTEIEEKIRQGIFAASTSKNPWFDLPGPAEPKVSLPGSDFDAHGEPSMMESAKTALYAPEAGAGGARINSLELFISSAEKNFVNSKGHEFKAGGWKGYSEFVVETDSSQGPVELFDDIEFSDIEKERLGEATGSRLGQVIDRATALPLPSLGNIPVILSGKEAEKVFAWFFGNAGTDTIFTKASPFTLGMNVQEREKGGGVVDPLDIWAEPVLAGLPASAAFDEDGFPLERTAVIEGGRLTCLVGPIRYADWLGQPRKGAFSLFSVSPGSMSLTDMRALPCLEPVAFSDFRLNAVTGDFGAEIRLAYWFDGQKRVPVTGGSISGSVAEIRSIMRRSSERALAARSLCPRAILIDGLSVTGIA
ncbi:MAG: metallopeptidase TldD-related protein [Rectinemataceae bacterium]